MARRHACRQVEGKRARFQRLQAASRRRCRTRPRSSSRACWTIASRARSAGFELSDRSRNDIGHDAGALAAAENKNAQRIVYGREWPRRPPRRPQAAPDCPSALPWPQAPAGVMENVGEGRGDGANSRRQQPVRPADHRVCIMHQGRNTAPGRRKDRRDRRITTEAHHCARFEAADQRPSLGKARGERRCGPQQRDRVTRTQRRAGDDVTQSPHRRAARRRGSRPRHGSTARPGPRPPRRSAWRRSCRQACASRPRWAR